MSDRLLRVDLTNRTLREEAIPPEVLQRYIGGRGLAAYFAHTEIPPHVDALEPENKLLLFIGPLAGVFNVYSRHVLAAKSPLTSTFCDSYAGGGFGAELARTGYRGVIFEGKADRLVSLRIDRDGVSLEDAQALAYATADRGGDHLRAWTESPRHSRWRGRPSLPRTCRIGTAPSGA
jgi:aldehyde:ferredoxin oxidoreductase